MSNILVVSDVDGVITSSEKGFYLEEKESYVEGGYSFSKDYKIHIEPTHSYKTKELKKVKFYSDHDSAILSLYKDCVVFISHDNDLNREWAKRKEVPFIYVPEGEEKYCVLKGYLKTLNIDEYVYIGDTIKDYKCLFHAKYGYYPLDVATSLKNKIWSCEHITEVPRNGGAGVLDHVIIELVGRGFLEER